LRVKKKRREVELSVLTAREELHNGETAFGRPNNTAYGFMTSSIGAVGPTGQGGSLRERGYEKRIG